MLTRRPAARGFTLVETMVAVAISAILASIGYPSFADQVRKARLEPAQIQPLGRTRMVSGGSGPHA